MKKQMVKLFAAVAFVFALSTPSTTGEIGRALTTVLDLDEGSDAETVVLVGSTIAGTIGGNTVAGPIGMVSGTYWGAL